MNKRRLCLYASLLLATHGLAQTNSTATATHPNETAAGINENLVTPNGKPIATRITVGFLSDHIGPESGKPGVARIVTTDGRELRGFALIDGENKDAVVGYLDEDTLMVREQKGPQLSRVFSPRAREKIKSQSETTADGAVTRLTYDGRPMTEAESYVFGVLGWLPEE